jgi:hypothetical protein
MLLRVANPGNQVRRSETSDQRDYVLAFGLGDRDTNGGVFIGWDAPYMPGTVPVLWALTPDGEGWTRSFWNYVGRGIDVEDASLDVYNPFDPTTWGWMSDYLVLCDEESASQTWLWR